MAKFVTETRVTLQYTEAGKETAKTVLEEDRAAEWMKEFDEKGVPYQKLNEQTFKYPEVEEADALGDLAAICQNPTEQANIINDGIGQKCRAKIRGLMLAKDFAPVEGEYDLTDFVGTLSEGRKTLTPEQKLIAQIAKVYGKAVTIEELNAAFAAAGLTQ